MIEYELSQRQRKELDRNAELRIALPVDSDWQEQGTDWVVARLPEITGREVRDIREAEVWVDWRNRGDPNRPESVASRLGEIVDRDRLGSWDVFAIRAVVVTICDAHRPKTEYPTRWPGTWRVIP